MCERIRRGHRIICFECRTAATREPVHQAAGTSGSPEGVAAARAADTAHGCPSAAGSRSDGSAAPIRSTPRPPPGPAPPPAAAACTPPAGRLRMPSRSSAASRPVADWMRLLPFGVCQPRCAQTVCPSSVRLSSGSALTISCTSAICRQVRRSPPTVVDCSCRMRGSNGIGLAPHTLAGQEEKVERETENLAPLCSDPATQTTLRQGSRPSSTPRLNGYYADSWDHSRSGPSCDAGRAGRTRPAAARRRRSGRRTRSNACGFCAPAACRPPR